MLLTCRDTAGETTGRTMFSFPNLVLVAGTSLAAVVVVMVVTAIAGRVQGRVAVVDTAWPLGFLLIAVVALVLGDGSWWRRILFVVLVGVWAGRLAWYVSRRNHGKGEDPRYAKMLGGSVGVDPPSQLLRRLHRPVGPLPRRGEHQGGIANHD